MDEEGDNESKQIADRMKLSKTAIELLPTAERVKESAAEFVLDDRNPAVGATSPRSQVPNEGDSAVDEGKGYSMARSGRKAAKRAAEKISVKKHKPKKDEKNKYAEEDPCTMQPMSQVASSSWERESR